MPRRSLFRYRYPSFPDVVTTYRDTYESNANSTTYTSGSISIGTASGNKVLFIGVVTVDGGTSNDILTVTVNGAGSYAATQIIVGGGYDIVWASLWAVVVPNEASVTVTAAFSSLQADCAITVISAENVQSISASDSVSDGSATGAAIAASIDVAAGGCIVGFGICYAASSAAWTGLTETSDGQIGIGSTTHTSAKLDSATAQTVAITLDSSAANPSWLVTASFR